MHAHSLIMYTTVCTEQRSDDFQGVEQLTKYNVLLVIYKSLIYQDLFTDKWYHKRPVWSKSFLHPFTLLLFTHSQYGIWNSFNSAESCCEPSWLTGTNIYRVVSRSQILARVWLRETNTVCIELCDMSIFQTILWVLIITCTCDKQYHLLYTTNQCYPFYCEWVASYNKIILLHIYTS